jgi:hypothetical protein
MSANNFISEIWSAKIAVAKENASVAAKVCNRSFEGELKAGNTVRVNQIADVTVNAYTKASTSSATVQMLSGSQTVMSIDKQYDTYIGLDDIDAVQANVPLMQAYSAKAGYALANNQDSIILGMYAQALNTKYKTGTDPVDMNSLNVEDTFLAVYEYFLGFSNVDPNKVFAIIPPWVHTKLVTAGIANMTDNNNLYKAGGFAGKMLGFNFYVSNNVSASSTTTWADTRIICGVEGESIALADQINKVIPGRIEGTAIETIFALNVFGTKVMRPDLTVTLHADKTDEPTV